MHLLVVDDDAEVLALIVETLESFGHSVVTATNGAEALAAFQKDVFRLVITDWQMPEVDGPALCRAIRSSRSPGHTYIIMLTALHGANCVVSGLDAGADDYQTKPFAPEELRARVRVGERLLAIEARDLVLSALAELVEFRDNETGQHIKRVQHYARLLAQYLCDASGHPEVNAGYVLLVHETSALHDVGKVAIPDTILRKPGKLTRGEFEVMKTHAAIGRRFFDHLLQKSPGAPFLEMCRDIAGSHHERWDGAGYPEGLKGAEIPLAARLMAVADVYDGLTSERCYRKAMSHDEARTIILDGTGTHFDPAVVNAFQAHEEEFRETATAGSVTHG